MSVADDHVEDPTPGTGLVACARALVEILEKHPVASGVVYAGWVSFKVLAVSLWTLSTALAILRLTPLTAIVAGAGLSALPMVALVGSACVFYAMLAGYWTGRGRGSRPIHTPSGGRSRRMIHWLVVRRFVLLILLLSGVFALALSPYALVLAAAAGAILLGCIARTLEWAGRHSVKRHGRVEGQRQESHRATDRVGTTPALHLLRERTSEFRRRRFMSAGCLLLVATILALGYTQVVDSMWLPHEDLYNVGGTGVVGTGYVVSEDAGTIYMLKSGHRTLAAYQAQLIGRREVCTVTYDYPFTRYGYETQTLYQWIRHIHPIPKC